MKHFENSNFYKSKTNMTFRNKITGEVIGTGVDIGVNDSIDNYEEITLTLENDIEDILTNNNSTIKKINRHRNG